MPTGALRLEAVDTDDEAVVLGPAPRGQRPWLVPVLAGALLVAVVALVLAFTVFKSDGSSGSSSYQGKVPAALRPVVSANRRVSASLAALQGKNARAARRAVGNAQQATVAARGALNATDVPSGQEREATNARQTLSRETAYLSSLSNVLGAPNAGAAVQAQTLASNLTDALDVMSPSGQDWAQSVSGADRLATWTRALERQRRKAAARRLRGHARRDQHDALGALIRSIFTADSGDKARRRLGDAVAQLEPRLSKVARLLEDAEDDVLAFYEMPAEHWPKLRSTNPLERFNREIGRRTDVVGIFPDDASVIRLASMLAIEANDEWLVGRSYISQKSMAPLWAPRDEKTLTTQIQDKEAELVAA
jgi:hypothetical protein